MAAKSASDAEAERMREILRQMWPTNVNNVNVAKESFFGQQNAFQSLQDTQKIAPVNYQQGCGLHYATEVHIATPRTTTLSEFRFNLQQRLHLTPLHHQR